MLRSLAILLMACAASLAAAEPAPAPAATPDSAAPAADAPAPTVDESYVICAGDRMNIEVFDHSDLSLSIHVPVDGRITFPLIGDITGLVGRRVKDLASELKKRLEDGYITEAIVTISFSEFGPRTAYVMGSVRAPSAVALSPFVQRSAMQAISQAGGFNEDANRAGAHVIRDDPAHPGKKMALVLPANDGAEEMVKDVTLMPGDLVIVPRLDRIYILGQVKRPGPVDIPSQGALTVSKAIGLAGGFDRFGKDSDVQLIRAGQAVREVDVHKVLAGNGKTEDPVLQPGDTVFVPETRF